MPKSTHIIGSEGFVLELDNITTDVKRGRMVIVDAEQHAVNLGERFSVYDYDGDVDSAKYWHLRTPIAPALTHIRLTVTASKSGTLETFRDAVLTDNGVELETINDNHCSSCCCEFKVYKDPVVTSDGDRTGAYVIGSDSVSPVGGSGGDLDREKTTILKQDSSYLAKFTPQSTDTRVAFELHFVEIEGGE
jgi:hypothetical protein